MPSSPPHSASKLGCMLANTPHDPSPGRLVLGDHLEVLEPMTAARHRRCSELVDDPLECGHDGGDRGVTDDVEARGDAGLGAGA